MFYIILRFLVFNINSLIVWKLYGSTTEATDDSTTRDTIIACRITGYKPILKIQYVIFVGFSRQ